MPDQQPVPAVADEVSCLLSMTEYDDRPCETYIHLINADNQALLKGDIARRILRLDPTDPTAEPERARKTVESHIARARWIGEVGNPYLIAGAYPGRERRLAENFEFLPSLGVSFAPRHGRFPITAGTKEHGTYGLEPLAKP